MLRRGVLRKAGRWARDADRVATSREGLLVARVGYAAKGLTYVLVGIVVALSVGQGHAGSADTQDALGALHGLPLGPVLLGAIGIGLLCYALWKLIMAILDPEQAGHHWRGLAIRVGDAIISATHLGLGLAAFQIITAGKASSNSDTSLQGWVGWALQAPVGTAGIVLAGLAVLTIAGHHAHQALTAGFRKRIHADPLSARQQALVIGFGRVGFLSQGIVFGVIGVLLVHAGLNQAPHEAVGFRGAMESMQAAPGGPAVLGFITFGLYFLVQARYGRMAGRNSGA